MKNIIITAVLTSVVLVSGYFAYTVIQVRKQTTVNTANIQAIADFLQKATQANTSTKP